MTPTEEFINALTSLKTGDLGLLRTHSGQGLDESVNGFDLFAGLWWPLRQRSERTPRRSVAWLIAKLYAFCPIPHSLGDELAVQLAKCQPTEKQERTKYQHRVDGMLSLPLKKIEPALQWGLAQIASKDLRLDWVKLTNDLSIWERESIRRKWAEQFLKTK